MNNDLEQALAQMAHSVQDDGTPDRIHGQVRHMVGRIRRRRAARHTATGVVGVGAVAAIAVGGVQLVDDRDDGAASPAAPTPHLLDPPQDACGLSLAELGWTGAGPVSLEPYEDAPTGREDGGVSLSTHVVKREDVTLSLDASAPRFVAVDPQTGHVVGVPAEDTTGWEPDWAAAVDELGLDEEQAQEFMSSASMPLRDCDADPDDLGPEANLDAGTYDIHAMQVLHPEETYQGLDTFVAVGGPWSVDVGDADASDDPGSDEQPPPTGEGDDDGRPELTPEQREARDQIEAWKADPVQNPEGVMPRCGAEAVLDDGSTPLVLDPPLGEEALDVSAGRFESTVTMRTRDGQYVIGNAAGAGATLALMQDGVVVGYQWLDSEDLTQVDLQPEQTLEIPLRGNRSLCGTGEGGQGPELPLPPGTYQAVAVVDVMLKEVGVPGGRAESVTRTVPVMSEPTEVTIG